MNGRARADTLPKEVAHELLESLDCQLVCDAGRKEAWNTSGGKPFRVPYMQIDGGWRTSRPGLFRIAEAVGEHR